MNALAKHSLKALSYIAPLKAGQIATKLFTQSRNATNPYKKAYTPIGAKSVSLEHCQRKVKQFYLWGESGDIVLLIHGWGAECGSMFSIANRLVKQGYRVAAFDAPAHGSSDGQYASMSEYVADTKYILQALSKLGNVTRVVAHSLGGIVAMAAISEFPSVNKAVLISTPFSLTDVLNIWSQHVVDLRENARQGILNQLLKDNGVPVSHWDVGFHGNNTQAETLVIHANNDNVVNCEHGKRISHALPNSKLAILKDLGHVKILSAPATHDKIATFFS